MQIESLIRSRPDGRAWSH